MTKEKQFDAVKLMRSARDKVAAEIESLSPEEQLARLNRPLSDPVLERIRQKAVQPDDAAADAPRRR